MTNRLNIPEDLASLIEKREAEQPRRQEQRRTGEAENVAENIDVEQRSGNEPRQNEERRSD
jgi:hypothetical protein